MLKGRSTRSPSKVGSIIQTHIAVDYCLTYIELRSLNYAFVGRIAFVLSRHFCFVSETPS